MTRVLGLRSWVGLGVIGTVIALFVIGFAKPNLGGGTGDVLVRVTFRDTSSLARFDRDVRVAGTNVGTVGSVHRDGNYAVVELRFPHGSIGAVHTDAFAELRPHTVFDGTAFVEFSPGSPDAPLLDNHVLGVDHTRDYVSLDRALRVADPGTRAALQGALHDLAATLRPDAVTSLRQVFQAQPRLFRSLAPAMRAFQGPSRTELAGTIRGFSQTVDGIAQERDSLGPLLRAAAQTIAAVRTQSDRPLDQTLVALPTAFAESATGGVELRGIIDRLDPFAVDLTPGMRELAPLLTELRPLLHDARPVLARSPGFVTELSGALQSGASASPPTGTMLQLLDPTLVVLRDGLLPFFHGKTQGGLPVYQELPGFGASAGGSMSAVRSQELAQAGNTGAGHAWHLYTASGSGFSGPPACATYAPAIQAGLLSLGLCRP